MLFPEAERVIYNKNPLQNVICQLRFPPILMIDSEVPSEFQEQIRHEYPLYEEKIEYHGEVTAGPVPQFRQDLVQFAKASISKNHEFSSEDGIWRINLTRTFISISTSKYNRWEDFRARFENPFDALMRLYKPPFFTRAGLRYVDVFCRSAFGLPETNWKDLIQDYFLGLLSTGISESIKNHGDFSEIALDGEGSVVRIVTSFVNRLSEDNETCYMVDSDFNTHTKLQPDKVFEKLDLFHGSATRLIRWIIKDQLHHAMEPTKI